MVRVGFSISSLVRRWWTRWMLRRIPRTSGTHSNLKVLPISALDCRKWMAVLVPDVGTFLLPSSNTRSCRLWRIKIRQWADPGRGIIGRRPSMIEALLPPSRVKLKFPATGIRHGCTPSTVR